MQPGGILIRLVFSAALVSRHGHLGIRVPTKSRQRAEGEWGSARATTGAGVTDAVRRKMCADGMTNVSLMLF